MKWRCSSRSTARALAAGWLALLPWFGPGTAGAAEVAGFRVTDFSGEIALRYLLENETGPINEYRPSTEEEIKLQAQGYVYHPNLLTFDVSGGPLWVQHHGPVYAEESLYNLAARLNFLETKVVPVSLYYSHENPSFYTSTAGHYLQENNKYGVDLGLRPTRLPIRASFQYSHADNHGTGGNQIIDDEHNQTGVHLSLSGSSNNHHTLSARTSRFTSSSGVSGLPIFPTITEIDAAELGNQWLMGKDNRGRLNSLLTWTTYDYTGAIVPQDRTELRFTPNMRWAFTPKLDAYVRYNLLSMDETTDQTHDQQFQTGMNYRPGTAWAFGGRVQLDRHERTGLTDDVNRLSGETTFAKKYSWGEFRTGYAGALSHHDYAASAGVLPVTGELITLSGISPVSLAEEYVDLLSINVYNLARTQLYVDGADYTINPIGSRVEIVRLSSGSIADGEQVSVDYNYQTYGNVGYNFWDQTLHANLRFARAWRAYVRYRLADATVTSGTPARPIDEGASWSTGLGADYQLRYDVSLGGEVTFDDFSQSISPYRRQSASAYLQLPMPRTSLLRFGVRGIRTDNLVPTATDVDLTGITVLLRSRPWYRAIVSLQGSYEVDAGPATQRELTGLSLRFAWRIRRLVLDAEGRYNGEKQGSYERTRSLVRFGVRREL